MDLKASLDNILVLSSCLENQDRITREAGDEDAIKNIAAWVSKSILPDESTISRDDIPSGMYFLIRWDSLAHHAQTRRLREYTKPW